MIEVFPPKKPIAAEAQLHDAQLEAEEDKRSQADFFGERDVEVCC